MALRVGPATSLTIPPLAERRAARARVLQTMSVVAQGLVLVALYVLWRYLGVPFARAAEWCVVAGVAIASALGTASAWLLTLARLRPASLLASQFTRLAGVGVFAALRYVQGAGLLKSGALLAGLYVVSGFVVRRIERRARQHWGA
jgi:hypothetical protein